ncbi:hypothetical protein ACHAXR_005223 [Thalassiosira sp. AJA248-18]
MTRTTIGYVWPAFLPSVRKTLALFIIFFLFQFFSILNGLSGGGTKSYQSDVSSTYGWLPEPGEGFGEELPPPLLDEGSPEDVGLLPPPLPSSIRGGKGGKNRKSQEETRNLKRNKQHFKQIDGTSSLAAAAVPRGKRKRPHSLNNNDQFTTTNTQQNRVYCMVPMIWTPTALPAYHAIRASWGKRCHILRFFIDPVIGDTTVGFHNMTEGSGVISAMKANMTLPPNDVVILHDMKRPWHTCGSKENDEEKKEKPIENCRNIFEKVWRMIVYVGFGTGGASVGDSRANEHEMDAFKAEWFVKVDSDTFLFPENVSPYVESKKWSFNDHHYFGHVLNHRRIDRKVSIVAGGAVFFSRATLLAAGDAFRKMPMEKGDQEEDGTCRDSYTGTEEVVTAVCLKEHSNIIAEPAIDSEGREQVSLYEVDDILRYNRTEQGEWWFWEGKKWFPCHDDGDCLAHLPLAFHGYKDSQYFLDFEKEFHGSVMNREEDESLVKKNDGRVAARHWGNFDRSYQYFERVRAAKSVAKNGDSLSSITMKTQSSQQTQQSNNRLYCMVPFIWTPKYTPSYHAIHKTWGRRCDILRFMIDPIIGDNETGFIDLRTNMTDPKLPDDVIVIPDIQRDWHICINDREGNCRNIWEKIWRSWIWVDSLGDSDLADWFVKVDADAFLFPENLKHYVKVQGWSPDDHHYFGHVLRHRMDDAVPIIAGAAVFFSRATMKGAANIFRKFQNVKESYKTTIKCQDAFTDQEEVITAVCLKEHLGVDADPMLDEMGQELVIVGEIEDVLMWNRTEQGEWWYWKNKPKKHPTTGKDNMHHCCGDLPIAFHGYKDPQWFFKLENEIYSAEVSDGAGDRWKNRKWNNPTETETYFDRVRKAMKETSGP